jgi:hypothetical protein
MLVLFYFVSSHGSHVGIFDSKELKEYQDELSSNDILHTLSFTKPEPLVFL